jgi:hypothetical protein
MDAPLAFCNDPYVPVQPSRVRDARRGLVGWRLNACAMHVADELRVEIARHWAEDNGSVATTRFV